MAKQRAEHILRDRDLLALPVDPVAIAEAEGITVLPKPDTEPGVSGMLLRHGDTFGILYATHLHNKGFERFSIGHELGHYFLDGHIEHVLPAGQSMHTSHAGFESAERYEREADHFSAGLLMPRKPFERQLGRFEPGLEAVEELATKCCTSLTATAIRYAELADDAVAVIMSAGDDVQFCFLSDTLKSRRDLTWLRKGAKVPKGTATAALNARPNLVRDTARREAQTELASWFGGNRSYEALEQVIGLGRYAKTLTVVTCPTILEATYQEGDEDDGTESEWPPSFRR